MTKRKVDWFRVAVILALGAAVIWVSIILGRSPVGLVLGADRPDWEVIVRLPEPGYRRADGTLLPFSEFSGTRVMYGTCDPATGIRDLMGEATVKSWQFFARLKVPADYKLCFVAVVMGLDGQPMGRSNVAEFSTRGPRPKGPVNLNMRT